MFCDAATIWKFISVREFTISNKLSGFNFIVRTIGMNFGEDKIIYTTLREIC